MALAERNILLLNFLTLASLSTILCAGKAFSIRIPDRISGTPRDLSDQSLKTAVFALGSFWRSEAVFGCLNGVVRTTAGYAGGSKINPEYRSLGDHAESVLVEYDPSEINFRQLLEIFWSSHDPRQVFGQGPDVGNQYRSIIFTNWTEEARLAAMSKEREQTKSRNSIVTTQVQQLGSFYPAEPEHQVWCSPIFFLFERGTLNKDSKDFCYWEHAGVIGKLKHECCVNSNYQLITTNQKFELKRHPLLLQLIGNLPEDELERSNLATKLNGYAAELCPPRIQKQIDAKINEIIRKGWPVLRDV
ncbi:Peptide methionine sulfoxide reductase MsrA domain - like 1 [Theobroma cacao]|nr:Peptide methionine sulfoxide reductase MsrA domain - like 1 [Theobroma cacao]